MQSVKVELDMPEDILLTAKLSRDRVDSEVKRLVAFELYRERLLSLGKACELANITKWEFFDMNKRLGIPLHYDEANLSEDYESVKGV
jgi:predicted HTH domain antitoxin